MHLAKILWRCVPFQGFSEGTASTFDYSLKDKAPFTVKNALGVPIKVQPNHNLRVMGSPDTSAIYDVDAGQNLELEYASMAPSCQGRLSTLSCQESSFFTLTFGMLYLFYIKGIFGIDGVGLFLTKYGKNTVLKLSWETTFLKTWNIFDKLLSLVFFL